MAVLHLGYSFNIHLRLLVSQWIRLRAEKPADGVSIRWTSAQLIARTYSEGPIRPTDIMVVLLCDVERHLGEGACNRNRSLAAQSTSTLQDAFLKHLRDNSIDVTMFLVNGVRLQGQIKRFDSFTVQLVRGNAAQLVYKHAISTIHPAEAIELMDPTSSG